MARSAALANQIADGVVTALALIDSAGSPNTYLTKPQTCERGLFVSALSAKTKPALLVEVSRFEDVLEGAGVHRAKITIGVTCIVEGGATVQPEKALNDLAADVMYAIAQNETLGGIATRVVDACTYEPQTEAMLKSGLAIATVSFSVEVQFDHTAANQP